MRAFEREEYIGPVEYPFLAEVRLGGEWQAELRRRFENYGVFLTANGLMVGRDEVVFGAYEMLEPGAVREQFSAMRWIHAPGSACPFLEPVTGYLRFSFDSVVDYDGGGVRHEALLCLIREGQGKLVRLPDDRWAESVVQRPFRLSGLDSKFGFEDGDAMLTRERGPYARHVVDAILAALSKAGYNASIGWMDGTCHNPVRFNQVEYQGEPAFAIWRGRRDGDADPFWHRPEGPPVEQPGMLLHDLAVELWAFNFEPLDDPELWNTIV